MKISEFLTEKKGIDSLEKVSKEVVYESTFLICLQPIQDENWLSLLHTNP